MYGLRPQLLLRILFPTLIRSLKPLLVDPAPWPSQVYSVSLTQEAHRHGKLGDLESEGL